MWSLVGGVGERGHLGTGGQVEEDRPRGLPRGERRTAPGRDQNPSWGGGGCGGGRGDVGVGLVLSGVLGPRSIAFSH